MFSNAVVDPGAVVVVLGGAGFADGTVVLSSFHLSYADHAELVESVVLGEFTVLVSVSSLFLALKH